MGGLVTPGSGVLVAVTVAVNPRGVAERKTLLPTLESGVNNPHARLKITGRVISKIFLSDIFSSFPEAAADQASRFTDTGFCLIPDHYCLQCIKSNGGCHP